MKRTMLRLLIVASGVVCMAWGQDPPDQEEGPGRGVARISLMNGDVSVRRGDSGEVVAAALNAPLVVEDQLLTGPDSRAEVQFDSANMVRLAPMSEVRFAELENQRYQLQVARGMVTFRVLRDSNAQVEISTPSVSVRPMQQGTYRITVREDGTTEISVRPVRRRSSRREAPSGCPPAKPCWLAARRRTPSSKWPGPLRTMTGTAGTRTGTASSNGAVLTIM